MSDRAHFEPKDRRPFNNELDFVPNEFSHLCTEKGNPEPARLAIAQLDDMFQPADAGLDELGLAVPDHALYAKYMELKQEQAQIGTLLESIASFRSECKWIPMEEQQRLFDERVNNLRERYRELVYAALTHPPLVVSVPRRQIEEEQQLV